MNRSSDSFSLNGKLVVITGASSGIGRQCAISCSKMGATIVAFGRNMERLNETLGLLDEPDKHMVCSVELREYEKVAEIIEKIVELKGRISGLINCAGISTTLPLNSISIQKMQEYFQSNVIASMYITQRIVKSTSFSELGGSIIFMGSVMGVAGEKGKTLYSMTKGALIAAVKSMAVELAPKKIRVNCISPGVVESPMSKSAVYSREEDSLNRIKLLHPLGLGRVDDVANASIFLLSDASGWITGTNLIVDGGYLAK